MDNGYFYFIMTAEQLVEYMNEDTNQKKMESWMKSKNVTEFSNPILVKCKFKSKK